MKYNVQQNKQNLMKIFSGKNKSRTKIRLDIEEKLNNEEINIEKLKSNIKIETISYDKNNDPLLYNNEEEKIKIFSSTSNNFYNNNKLVLKEEIKIEDPFTNDFINLNNDDNLFTGYNFSNLNTVENEKEKENLIINININNKNEEIIKSEVKLEKEIEIIKPIIDIEFENKNGNLKQEENKSNSSPIIENQNNLNKKNSYSTNFNTINTNRSQTAKNEYSTNNESKFKYEDINVANVIKRVLENNKKEASVRQGDFFQNYPQSFKNLNMNKSQNRFFIGSANNQKRSENYSRPFSSEKYGKGEKATLNYLEIIIKDIILWKKHEEIWNNISTTTSYNLSLDLEKHLIPPNDSDVILSSYSKLNNKFNEKIIIDDNIQNPKEEMEKWKKAYKRTIMRWHPDKLFGILENLKIKDENRKNIIKKKSSIVINNVNKVLQNILEILRKILIKKENDIKSKN